MEDANEINILREPLPEIVPQNGSVAVTQTLLDSAYTQVMATIHKGTLDPSDLILLTATAMQFAQSQKQLSGQQKKELVISVINQIIDGSGLVAPEAQAACHLLVSTTLSMTIDTIVSASQGQFIFGHIDHKGHCCNIM